MFVSDTPSAAEWASLDKSDNSSRAASIMIINGMFIGQVLLITFLRMFTKIFMSARLFIDDCESVYSTCFRAPLHAANLEAQQFPGPQLRQRDPRVTNYSILYPDLMSGSVILFTAVGIVNMYSVRLGSGSHVWDLPGITENSSFVEVSHAAAPVEKMNYVALIIIAPSIILAKLSIVSILLRVFPESMRVLRFFLFALATVLTACCITQALLVMFQCSPIQASWNIEAGDCYIQSLEAVTMGLGVLNLFTDLMLCITPIPYFWQLNMPKPQKICLCGLFMTGLM